MAAVESSVNGEEMPRCALCDAATIKKYDSVVPGFAIFECTRCQAGRTWPPVPESELGAWYAPSYYGTRNVRFNRFFEWLTRWFRHRRARTIRSLVQRGRFLDVGCGRGLTLSYLRSYGFQVQGLELSDVAARHAREVLGLDVRTDDFMKFEAPAGSYEAIIFWHSLEHFADPRAALARASQLLAANGLLVVAVPNDTSLQSRATGREWFHLDVPRHYVHFSTAALRESLEKCGLRVVETAHFSLEQNPYGWIQSLLNLVLEHNLLYSILKEPEARAHQLREFPLQTILSALGGVLLLPLSLALTMLETILRNGGTVEMYARKERP
jgi:2-polyprenyl-3-methyl-5-hydroxy-6-metoxy-1,4-benzoquinol methylase